MPSKAAPKTTPARTAPGPQAGIATPGETSPLASDIGDALGLDPADLGDDGATDEGDGKQPDDDDAAETAPENDEAEGNDDGEDPDDSRAEQADPDDNPDDATDPAEGEGAEAETAEGEESEAQDDAGEPHDEAGEDEGEKGEGEEGDTWPEGTPKWAKRQITELRAQLREARESASASPPARSIGENPLLDASDEAGLAALEERYAGIEEWADETLEAMAAGDYADTDAEGHPIIKVGEKTYTREQVLQAKRTAKRVLRQAPAARHFVAFRSASSREARKEYPWIDDPKDERSKMFVEAKKALPLLREVANADMIVADAIEGQRLRLARAKARAQASAGKKPGTPVRKPGKPAGAPPQSGTRPAARPSAAQSRAAKAAARLEAEGSTEALENLVDSMLENHR